MLSSDERITELEQRVTQLENILKSYEIEKSKIENPKFETWELEKNRMGNPGMGNSRVENNGTVNPGTGNSGVINSGIGSPAARNQGVVHQGTGYPGEGTPGIENPGIGSPVAGIPGIVKSGVEKSASVQSELIRRKPVEVSKIQQGEEKKQSGKQENVQKDKEALVGKYIIGALAAVLIFIAAISFIGLVWNRMTPEVKLFIISMAGILLSALGFKLIKTWKNPISSIILGTGAGLLFIAILSANMAFHLIGNNMSILLAGVWAVFFIISSQYTNLFFTTIIAYIGSYITLLLGLGLMQTDREFFMLILFTSVLSAIMIYTALQKSKTELVINIILPLASYTTILIRCFMDGLLGSEQLLHSYAGQVVVIIILYLLMNMFYHIINLAYTNIAPAYLGVSAVITIFTGLFISYLGSNYLNLKALTCYILFFTVNLLQFVINSVFFKKIEIWLTRYYIGVLVFASMLINIKMNYSPVGIVLIGLILIISEKIFKREHQSLLAGLIVLLDSLFLLIYNSDNLVCSVYGLMQIGLMVYVLWKTTGSKNYKLYNALKVMGIVVIIINCFGIPSNIINFINGPDINRYTGNAIGYLLAVGVTITLLKIGYFKNWKCEEFQFFGINDKLEDDKEMQILIYVLSTGLYFYGLQKIAFADNPFLQLIFTLGTIAIALIQSKTILSGKVRNVPFAGIWIVFKYLMLTWTILWAFLDLNIISVVYSIVGLLVAIGCISAGFLLKNRNIRLYGLVLTIIMVAKFILVDLMQENSIVRVLALIAGGSLCFLISFIYNKLSENYS